MSQLNKDINEESNNTTGAPELPHLLIVYIH